MAQKEEVTQVQVKKQTRKKLKDLKIVEKESYDEVIQRLIKDHYQLRQFKRRRGIEE